MKPTDFKATQIGFGVELETAIPRNASICVGGYHSGAPVETGRSTMGILLTAPTFNGLRWRADRDGSIRYNTNEAPCEFVSPILNGEQGVDSLCQFVEWMNAIGARVNDSCGCHVTVGVDSITGSSSYRSRGEFAKKLAHVAQWHARAIYGQTGSGRHLNHYSHTFAADVAKHVKVMERSSDIVKLNAAANACGRGMINFKKLFSHGVVEFRAFAGTTSLAKVQHHVATAIGLCRRAHEVQCLGAFKMNKLQESRTATAVSAVQFLWDYLGWTGRSRPVALGLFGRLHSDFSIHSREALRLCALFDSKFPTASL